MRILGAAPVGTVEFWGRWDGSHGSVDVPCTFSRHRKPEEIQKVRGVLPARDGNGHVNQPATKTEKANTKEGAEFSPPTSSLSPSVCPSAVCLFCCFFPHSLRWNAFSVFTVSLGTLYSDRAALFGGQPPNGEIG